MHSQGIFYSEIISRIFISAKHLVPHAINTKYLNCDFVALRIRHVCHRSYHHTHSHRHHHHRSHRHRRCLKQLEMQHCFNLFRI